MGILHQREESCSGRCQQQNLGYATIVKLLLINYYFMHIFYIHINIFNVNWMKEQFNSYKNYGLDGPSERA